MAEEIKKLVEVLENVEKNVNDTSSPLKNDDDQNVLGTRLDPKSDKESTEVEITIVVTPININEEEEETTDDGYELRQREKGKQELTKNDLTPSSSTPSSSPPKSKLSATNRLLSIFKAKPGHLRHYKSFFQELQGRYGYLFEHLSTKFMPRWKFNKVAHRLQEIILDSLPKLVDDHILIFLKKQVPLYVQERENLHSEISSQVNDAIANQIPSQDKFKRFNASSTSCRPSAVFPRDQEDPHDDALPEGENSAKRQKISEHGTFELGGSSSGQDYESEPGPSTSGGTRLEKIVMSLHKFPAVIFPDDDIEERTSRRVKKCVKKFNPYAWYNFEHWKNPHAKIFYIKKQQETGKPKSANGRTMSITESDYKNLKKNDIEDMYLLIINHKLNDYAETGLFWSLSVFIRSIVIWERVHDFQLGIEKYKVFSIVFEPIYGIIYENSKKEKRVMRHQEVHKFCGVTLKRVLKGLKSYNNNVKYGYVTPSLSHEDAEYLQLFKERIKE
ncbi:hypothetical protein Tco_0542435 [Tanacetum coccineum]